MPLAVNDHGLAQSVPPRQFYRFSPRMFFCLVLFCALPAAALLGTGHATWAGRFFWFLFTLTLVRSMLLGRRDETLCLVLAMAPFMNLLRSFAFYNVVIGTFLVVLLFYFCFTSCAVRATLGQFKTVYPLLIWVIGYYAVSLWNTHNYAVNLRLFELAFTIICILILGRNRLLLGSALVGTVLSALIIGAAMLPQIGGSIGRLGIVELEGRLLGNPAQLGMPLAFGFWR